MFRHYDNKFRPESLTYLWSLKHIKITLTVNTGFLVLNYKMNFDILQALINVYFNIIFCPSFVKPNVFFVIINSQLCNLHFLSLLFKIIAFIYTQSTRSTVEHHRLAISHSSLSSHKKLPLFSLQFSIHILNSYTILTLRQ